jgi:hypothetical protein
VRSRSALEDTSKGHPMQSTSADRRHLGWLPPQANFNRARGRINWRGSGLEWTNKLLVDGSMEVIGGSQSKFTSVNVSGTNLIFTGTNGTADANYAVLTTTNVTTPAANWQSLVTNQFGVGGRFSFTNSINLNEPQRFFRLRSP